MSAIGNLNALQENGAVLRTRNGYESHNAILRNGGEVLLLCDSHVLAVWKRDQYGLPVEFAVWSLDKAGNTDSGHYTRCLSDALKNYTKRANL